MVTLENGFAKPSRPTVSPGDKAVFVNKHNHSLRLEFESSRKGFNLGSRKTKKQLNLVQLIIIQQYLMIRKKLR